MIKNPERIPFISHKKSTRGLNYNDLAYDYVSRKYYNEI